jgi:HEPN domain-containing protein
MKKMTREWVRKAEADLAIVRRIRAAKPPLYDGICFHCQQAAEKYLKALMQERGLAVPRTHDLVDLVDLLLPGDSTLRSLRRGARSLRRFAVDARYPGMWASSRQANASWQNVQRMRTEVRKRLGI